MSDPHVMHETHGEATIEKLRAWVSSEVDAVSELTGIQTWNMLLDAREHWPANSERIFERSFLPHCLREPEIERSADTEDADADSADPGDASTVDADGSPPTQSADEAAFSVKIALSSDPLNADVHALVEQVRELWTSQKWNVTQIAESYFRADRVDGAQMTVEGADRPTGKRILLSVQSVCSADPTLAK